MKISKFPTVKKCAAAALFCVALQPPLIERSACAQQKIEINRIPEDFAIEGNTVVTIGNGKEKFYAHYSGTVSMQDRKVEERVVLRFRGPAKVTVHFYPMADAKKYSQGDSIEGEAQYSIDEKQIKQEYKTKISDLTMTGRRISEAIAIGQAVEITFIVEEGEHKFTMKTTDCLVRVPKQAEIDAQSPPPLGSAAKITLPAAIGKGQEAKKPRGRLMLRLQSEMFKGIAKAGNDGSMHELSMAAKVLHFENGPSAGIGSSAALHEIYVPQNGSTVTLKSASIGPRLYFERGKHLMSVSAYGGMIKTSATVNAQGAEAEDSVEFNFMARAGYEYGKTAGTEVTASNSPFNPASLYAFAFSPYGFAGRPKLELEARWLHLPRLNQETGPLDITLDYKDILARATATLPLVSIRKIATLSALGSGVLDSEGYARLFLGGSASIEIGKLGLEAGLCASIWKARNIIFVLRANAF